MNPNPNLKWLLAIPVRERPDLRPFVIMTWPKWVHMELDERRTLREQAKADGFSVKGSHNITMGPLEYQTDMGPVPIDLLALVEEWSEFQDAKTELEPF